MDEPLKRPDTAFTSRTYRESQKPKRKARMKDGIDKLEMFLDEYSPQMGEDAIKKTNTSSFVVQLINSILKDDGAPMVSSVTEAYGNKTVRGNLGPKVVDFDKDKEKHTERKGEPDDYVLLEQNDMERRIRGYKEDEKDSGPENALDSGAVGSGTVDVTKQFTGWDWKGQQGEYKRGTENDKIDDNPRIEKDTVDDFLLNLSKGEDGSEYVTEIYDDVEILTRDEDETRGTYTGNSAAYKYTQTLKKADDVKELKWTDKEELSEQAMKKANRDLKLFNMSLQDVDKIELPEPFANDSDEVKTELERMSTKNRNFHKNEKRKKFHGNDIAYQDENLFEAFVQLAKVVDMYQKPKDKVNLNMDKMKDLKHDTGTILLRLKLKYNRPRPDALLDYHGIEVTPEDLPMAKTPSYPSGHACQAKLIARILSKKYPEYKKKWHSLADEIANNRIIAGVHFPSDSKAGELLADELYDKLDMDNLKI